MSQRPRTERLSAAGVEARLASRLTAALVVLLPLLCLGLWPAVAQAGRPGMAELGVGRTPVGPRWAPPISLELTGPPSGGATIPTRPSNPEPAPGTEGDPEDEDDPSLEQPRAGEARGEDEDFELVTPTLQSKRNVPPFWIKRDFDTHTTRALTFPPVFVHRTPKAGHPEKLLHLDLSFTFAWYSKTRHKRRWMNPLVLYFGGFSEHKTVWAALPLLMGYRRVGEQFNFGQFPFVWWWGNKYVKNLFVFPFHYRKKAPDQSFGVSGLLAWYGNKNLDDDIIENDRRHFVLAPIYFRFQRGLQTIDASPIYFGGRNEATGVTHRTLLPLFHWQSREFGNRKELWTIPWIRRTDEARQRKAWAIPPLLSFRDRNPERDLLSVTPLVWRHQDLLRDRSTWVVGGIGGAIDDPDQRMSWAAPLWWRFVDKREDTALSVLAPLALWRRSPERFTLHTLVASGWRNKDRPGGGGGSLPLLSWVHHDPLRSRQFILGGLFWRFTNEDPEGTGARDPALARGTWGVGPLVYGARRGEELRRYGVPPLLSFFGRKGSKSHQVVTPLFWHFRDRSPDDPGQRHDTWVVPPLYFQNRAEGFRLGMPPLFVAANDERYRYAVLPWLLFGHVEDKGEQSSRTIWPLFVRTKTPTSRTLGAGLIAWDVRRQVSLEGGEGTELHRDSVLFPLYYRRQRGESTLHLSPLGGALRRPEGTTWVGTLAYGFRREDRRGGGLLPLFHHETRSDGATTALFPLFLRDRRPERDLDVWTPLIWRGKVRGDRPRNNLAVVPFYFGQRQPEGVDVDASLIFFWSRDRTRRTHTLVAGPFYHRLTREKLITGLGPLSYWEDSSKRRLLVVPPLIVSLENKLEHERTTVALPFWFDRIQRSGRRVWMAFPFAVGTYRRHDFTKAGILPPLFFDIHRLYKNYRFTGVVPFLFRYQKGGFRVEDEVGDRYTLWGSFPLFFYGRDGKGRKTHSALGLYWFDKRPEGWKFFTLLGGAAQKPGKELTWYAPLIYRKVTNEQHTTFLWPLFAYHKGYRKGPDGKPYKDISTTWVLPPVYVSRHNEDRRWWQSMLLVWQFKRPHKVSTAVVPPIFFIQDAYKQRRLHWLLPLYVRDNNMGKGEAWTSVIPGLFVQHRNQRHNNAVQFPLLWHFDNPKRRVTIGGFLWYDVRLPERGTETQVLPAVYARRKTEERVGHMIGPGLASWSREAEGQPASMRWHVLFWMFGGGNDADGERFMRLFWIKIKLPPKELKPRKIRERKRKREREARRSGRRLHRGAAEAARNEAIEADFLDARVHQY